MTAAAWVVRSGKLGERDQVALTQGCSGGGWEEIPDLTACTTRTEVATVVESVLGGESRSRVQNAVAQLWALRGRIAPGDVLVMPMKTTKQLALGRVTAGYRYLSENPPALRHVVAVDWQRTDLPRSAVKQDLLYTLGSVLTVFAPSKNNAVARLEHLLAHGTDPGAVEALPVPRRAGAAPVTETDGSVDSPELSTDFEQAATDQILTRIGEDFTGHELARLVTAVLEAEGFRCDMSPPGPDGGIDITAGRGPLGLDTPTLLVQVKSGGQVGAPVVSQLQGVMSTQGADQGLLVAWDGLTRPAREQMRHHRLRIRVWEAADVVDAVLRNYARLPSDIQTLLPLKQVWMLSNLDD
ncbi:MULTISPECIES: restriction endonuclease [Rhodococcus]|uniref:restriction endonuclease n=1 Tax=Rhodococcus TaxID=1827 RepID=UPI000C9A4DC5|nr:MULTISPECIES: restriction endonuclease [Rhodococcus]PND53615.1 restriction endonuclease [Rhodococcus sp. ENV425]WKW98888.1 restriction endonuclease [Rhodococcus aetherivorans]